MRAMRRLAGPVAVGVLVVGMFFGLKLRYGDYNHYYFVKVDLPRAGQLLRTGTDVRERGVVIGKVSKIELVNPKEDNPHAQLTLQIDPQYRIPQGVQAFVDLKTLLGDKYVDLRTDRFNGPWLHDGATIQGQVGPELEDVLQNGTHLFDAINPNDLATVVGNLAQAARGHGADVRENIQTNARLSGIFARTLPPQIRALNDFVTIFGALKSKAIDLNRLADAVNQGAPVYASPRAHTLLRRALITLKPFAQNLADLLIFQRGDWNVMMDAGDKVLQTVSEHTTGLHSLVHGLYIYVSKLGGTPPYLSDGSGEAPFSNFSGGVSFMEQVHQICGSLPQQLKKQIPICQQARYR
jgi:phospholipid/cholesterol/gamma-HCH transport system substrate-binding protein